MDTSGSGGFGPAVLELAERLGAAVLTTSKLKGAIPEDHPLRAGCIIGGLIERKLVERSRDEAASGKAAVTGIVDDDVDAPACEVAVDDDGGLDVETA